MSGGLSLIASSRVGNSIEESCAMSGPAPHCMTLDVLSAAASSRASNILVVDDDPSVLRSVSRLLRSDGYEVAVADSSTEALRVLMHVQPDLVLLDVMMPAIDGYGVCEYLKKMPETRRTPVILLTALDGTDDRVRGFEVGADAFLSKPFERMELLARVRSLLRAKQEIDQMEEGEAVLFTLARSIEARDPYTEGHCERLSTYACALGEILGLGEDDLNVLRRAAIVHDIGKIGVPDAILLKPGPLTNTERSKMQEHPEIGERICCGLKTLRPVLPVIRFHHEKSDGSGYPDGITGDAIPLNAKVLQVVDVYDALTTARSYKPAMPPDTAIEQLHVEAQRGWWDSDVVGAFTSLVGDTVQ